MKETGEKKYFEDTIKSSDKKPSERKKAMEKTIGKPYSCYSSVGLLGYFICYSVKEAREKIQTYNKTHKQKIVRFKSHRPTKNYEV
jgi:hypothetical protein